MGGYGGSRANAANLCSCRCFALYKKTEFITGATPESQELHTREGCGPLEHKPGCPRIFAQFATARRKRGHLTADLRPDKVLTMNETNKQQLTVGEVTFALIDGPDDVWYWAIVTEYRGCQEYGAVLMAFAEGMEPNPRQLEPILKALDCAIKEN